MYVRELCSDRDPGPQPATGMGDDPER